MYNSYMNDMYTPGTGNGELVQLQSPAPSGNLPTQRFAAQLNLFVHTCIKTGDLHASQNKELVASASYTCWLPTTQLGRCMPFTMGLYNSNWHNSYQSWWRAQFAGDFTGGDVLLWLHAEQLSARCGSNGAGAAATTHKYVRNFYDHRLLFSARSLQNNKPDPLRAIITNYLSHYPQLTLVPPLPVHWNHQAYTFSSIACYTPA